MKKVFIMIIAALLIATIAISVIGCDSINNTGGSVYNRDEFMDGVSSVFIHKYNNNQKIWEVDIVKNANYDTLTSANNFNSFIAKIKTDLITNNKKMRSFMFVVEAQTNCTINFALIINSRTDVKYFEQQEIALSANTPIRVTFYIDKNISDLIDNEYPNFIIETNKFEEVPDDAIEYKRTMFGKKYNYVYTATEVEFTVSDFQAVIEDIKA